MARTLGAKDKEPRKSRREADNDRLAVTDAKRLRAENALEVQTLGLNALRLLAMVAFEKGEFSREDVNIEGKIVKVPVVTLAQRLKALDKLVQKGLPDLHKIDLSAEKKRDAEREVIIDIVPLRSPQHFRDELAKLEGPDPEDA